MISNQMTHLTREETKDKAIFFLETLTNALKESEVIDFQFNVNQDTEERYTECGRLWAPTGIRTATIRVEYMS